MTSYKLYKPLFLSLSLALAGCGGGGDDDSEETTPEVTALSVVNPIADQLATVDSLFSFELPTDICSAATGVDITLQVTQVSLLSGLSILGGDTVFGAPKETGVASITITCSTDTESVTDEFTITVSDKIANPTVEVNAPNTAKEGSTVTLKAIAEDGNITGSIVSYAWEQTSGIDVTLTNADSAEVTFTAPDSITTQSSLKFSVTVTDNDGATDTDSVEIDLISALAPDVALSFPLALGVYSGDTIDMFGTVEAATGTTLASVAVFVDDVEHNGNPAHNAWRVSNVTITDNSEIKVVATSTDGFINYEEITLVKTLYKTSIDDNISDIAVSESTGDIYVHSDGDKVSKLHITKFNLDTAESEELSYTKDATYGNFARSSIATDSENLYLSSPSAITKIDLSTNIETVLSDATTGTDSGTTAPDFIIDLGYDPTDDSLYYLDINNAEFNSVSPDGDRSILIETAFAANPTSVIANIRAGKIFYSKGATTTDEAVIYADPFTDPFGNDAVAIYTVQSTANGGNGAPISDLALNETGNELYFVDGSGDLIKLDVSDITATATATTVVENLFSVESIVNSLTPLIGLHYDSTRNLVIAAGRDADGTNKLLVIDPVSGDYAKVATGTFTDTVTVD